MTNQGDSVTGERPEAETLARAFHETYERLAPTHGYATREESAFPWEDVPTQNKGLMVTVAAKILEEFWPAEPVPPVPEPSDLCQWSLHPIDVVCLIRRDLHDVDLNHEFVDPAERPAEYSPDDFELGEDVTDQFERPAEGTEDVRGKVREAFVIPQARSYKEGIFPPSSDARAAAHVQAMQAAEDATDDIVSLVQREVRRAEAVEGTSIADLYEEIREVKTEVRTNGNRWADFMDEIAARYGFA